MSGSKLSEAKTIAFRLIKIRARSEKEIFDRLKKKKIQSDIIQKTIDYLKEYQYLDDLSFTKSWIRSRLNKPFGLEKISLELKEKGVDPNTVKQELDFVKDGYAEYSIVLDLAKKRLGKYKCSDRQKQKRRIFEYLARRGFSSESIYKALREL